MDGGHVHVVGLGFEDRAAARGLGLQQRLQLQRFGRLEPVHARHQPGIFGRGLLQAGVLLGAAGDQRAARRQHRMVGEALRQIAVEAAGGDGDRADHGAAVGLRMERGGPAGRVIGGHVLALEDDHLGARRQVIGGGDAGNAGADDGEIEFLHGPHIAWLPSRPAIVGPP